MANTRPVLEGEQRERTGTKYATRLRRQGKMPAVIYGHGQDPAHVALDAEAVHDALHDGAHLLDLNISGGKAETVLIKDIQFDFLGDNVIHIDLARVDLSEEVTVNVSIELEGEDAAPGLKEDGALLQQPTTDLEVRCRADQIPDKVTVDISALEAGQAITVSDLTLPAGVKAETDEDTVIASISIVSEEEMDALDEATADTGTSAEPEVITERHEDEEGGEAEAAPKKDEE
jgi:large subunit ribosomal protein L25